MYVADYMTSEPITILADMLIPQARRLMSENNIRHLPVVDRQRRLIGMVTDRDLRSAYPSSVASRSEKVVSFGQVEKSSVAEIMATECATLSPDATIDDALLLFDNHKIGGIPVVSDSGEVLGIFSLLDLTSAYKKLFGVAEDASVLFGVEDDGRENILCKLVTLLAEADAPLSRLLRLPDDDGIGKIYMRVRTPNPLEVVNALKSENYILIHCD